MKQKILQSQNKRKDSHSGSVFGQYKEVLLSMLDKQTSKYKKGVDTSIQELIQISIDALKGNKQGCFFIDDLFSDSTWKCELHCIFFLNQNLEQYLCQLQNLHSQQFNLLVLNLMIADGYFDQKFENYQTQVIHQAAPRPLSNLFILNCNEIGLSILFEVGIHKNHIIEGYEELIGFEINHKITFIDVRNEAQQAQIINTAQQYVKQIQRNPYRTDLPLIKQDQVIIPQIKQSAYLDSLLYKFEDPSWGQLVFGESGKVKRWIPYEFPKFRLKQSQVQKFQWEDNKYISKDWINIKSMNKNYTICKQINKVLFQQYADFKSASKIIDFLHTHTQFKTKLSVQERELLEETGNIMVIGRSGTGKTTCAILRLFSMQLLLKYRVKITGQKIKLFKHSQIENKNIGLHCLFTAQNQMLVDEVKQQYRKFLLELRPQNAQSMDKSFQQSETETESDADNLNRNELQNLLFNQNQQVDLQIEREELTFGRQRELDQQSLHQFKDNDFPIFLSIKELILLFDNCLTQPYLQNERFLVEENQNDHAGWQVGETHQIKIYLDDGRYKIVRIIEVDYLYFKTIFWPTIQNQLRKQQNNESYKNLIWTQIYSYIKGSEFSHQYLDQGLPFQVFYNNFNQMLTLQQAQEIYDIYLNYEKWKDKQGIFDRMDIVNYQINCVERFQFKSNPIHYTMIDEIQDLPHATIKLISKLTEQNLYCSGDTAQNIQKGVGFRFQDLRSLLMSEDKFSDIVNEKVKLHQLTINFRSHDQILQLANNVVSLIETLFPKTIDKLKKELSEKQGPKPFIIKSNNFQTLIQMLKPQNLKNQNQQQIEQINLMGAEKVIIVRSNNDKKKINQIIDNILVLTVHEAKGLEFNDVILFNFFMEEEIQQEQWQLLQHIKFDSGKMQIDPKFNYQPNNYGPLCLELKQLYVCLTRAKFRIIIFDEDISKRQIIESIWTQQQLVASFNDESLYDNHLLIQQPNKQLEELQRQGWREKGKKLFEVKNYNEAMKCFKFSGDQQLEDQCKAFFLATSVQQELNYINAKFKCKSNFPKIEQERIVAEQKRVEQKSREDFRISAQIFQRIGCHVESAQCFFSAKLFEQAIQEYLLSHQYLGAADSAFEAKLYQLAGMLYLKSNYFEKSIQSFEKESDYFIILLVLFENKQYYNDQEYETKLHKFIPLFLQQVFDKFLKKKFHVNLKQIYDYLSSKEKDFKIEFEMIRKMLYPATVNDLIDCIWNVLKLNQKFLIKKLESSILNYNSKQASLLFQQEYIEDLLAQHHQLITDIIGYYDLYDLLDFLSIEFKLVSKEDQVNMFFQTMFKYSQVLENNSRQKISDYESQNFGVQYKRFTQSQDLKDQKQYFGILYMFGFQRYMKSFLNELKLVREREYLKVSQLLEFKKIEMINYSIDQLISDIPFYMDIRNEETEWDECVFSFFQIINFIQQEQHLIQNNTSELLKLSNHDFRSVLIFLSFAANILKYNQNLHIQLQVFEAFCIHFQIIIPRIEIMQNVSQLYLIIHKSSQFFSQKIAQDSIYIGEEIYLVQTDTVIKEMRKKFQDIINMYIKSYYQQDIEREQIQLQLYQQFFQTKHQTYFENNILYQQISRFQVDYIFYLEKGLRIQFNINLENIQFPICHYLNNQFLNFISYQYLVKSILNIDMKNKIDKIIKGIKLSSLQSESEILQFFNTFRYSNNFLEEGFTEEQIQHLEMYQKSLLCHKQQYVDFDYLNYTILSHRNLSLKNYLIGDFKVSFLYILILLNVLQGDDGSFQQESFIIHLKIELNSIKNILNKFEQQFCRLQNGNQSMQIKGLFNHSDQKSYLQQWLQWYFINFNIIGDKYLIIFFENCNSQMRNFLIEQIKNSQQLSKAQKENLLTEGKYQDIEPLKEIIYRVELYKNNKNQSEKYQNRNLNKLQIALNTIEKYEIKTASTTLTATEYFRYLPRFNRNIYFGQFNKCFYQIGVIRKKILLFIYKFCNNPIKFRTAMNLLLRIKEYEKILFENLEMEQNQFERDYFEFDDRGLFKQLQFVEKQLDDWQQKNVKFWREIQNLNAQLCKDRTKIKLWRKITFRLELKSELN